MLNVYLNYVSSLETGDVNVSKQIYTSHGKAAAGIDTMIQQYVSDKKIENYYRIINKENFDSKKISKDNTISNEEYIFKLNISSACIYKKILIEGRLWNGGFKLEKIGKIGVLPEINIPIDNKLIKLVEETKEQKEEICEIPEAPICSDDITEKNDEYKPTIANPSNYEHGKHVSFIHELKEKIEQRKEQKKEQKKEQRKEQKSKENQENTEMIIKSTIAPKITNDKHSQFINELYKTKEKLQHIIPPDSPIYGKVISNDPIDLPPVPDLPIVSYSLNHTYNLSYTDDDMDSLDDSLDYTYSLENTEEISIIPPAPIEKMYNDKHVEKIVEEIMTTINLNNNFNTNNNVPNTPHNTPNNTPNNTPITPHIDYNTPNTPRKDNIDYNTIRENIENIGYDNDQLSYDENQWEIIDYYEGVWNSNPVKRKYVDVGQDRRLSL